MRLIKIIRNLTKWQRIFLVVIFWQIVSALMFLMYPAFRRGPMGFGPPADMTIFRASDGSFSISYPENWTVFETPDGNHGDDEVIAHILVAGHQMANVTIARRSFPRGDLGQVVAWGQLRAARLADYKSISLNPVTINGHDDYLREYSWSHLMIWGDKEFSHCQDEYIFDHDTGYSLSFCSSEADSAVLQSYYAKMQQSFSVKALNQ